MALAACDNTSVRETMGLNRQPPDEFRVVSRPPLTMPPDFNLRPPLDAVTDPSPQPRDDAQQLLLGSDSVLLPGSAITAVAPVGEYSLPTDADTVFLQKAGAQTADPNIRAALIEEAERYLPSERNLIDDLNDPIPSEPVVNAEEEAERLRKNKTEGASVTQGETPMIEPTDKGPLGRLLGR